ncbi:hypothetical protein ANCDUO_22912 [Ancylostoma duodenale]|uniref:Phlebovirus glycoprotein G2 fusion domain-containing protein n=1 Tax=Ancylostoma duodenale TaxID=51022 RepID=A0A0C2FEN8_9BILA|nr:hypothetical protein ANCDUO_22912 [Ancylostoma duodenale]
MDNILQRLQGKTREEFNSQKHSRSHILSQIEYAHSRKPNTAQRTENGSIIELFDNTLILVPELHVRRIKFLHKDDYYCFDHQGNELEDRSRTTTRSGTAAFRRRHPCVESEEANAFCAYLSEVTTYEAKNTSIMIKAWGTTMRTYYPYKELPSNATTPHFTVPQCATGGLQIDTTEKFEMIEICNVHVCIYISDHEPKSRILLPTLVVLFDYVTSIQAWTNGTRQFRATLKCKGKTICEIVVTFLRMPLVDEYQTSSFTKKVITFIIQRIGDRRRKYTLPQFPSYSKRRTHKFSRTTLALAMLLQLVQPCSDVVSVTSTSNNCKFDGTTETCIVDQAVTLHLQPIGQESCLLLRGSNSQPAGTISLRLHNVTYQCQQKTQYYTHDHSIHTESNH